MDLPYILKKYGYVVLLSLYFISAILRFKSDGWVGFIAPAGLSLITAIIQTAYNNVKTLKRVIRKLKYFIGTSTFTWDTEANFLVRQVSRLLDDTDQSVKQLIIAVLKENNIKASPTDIEISKDSLKHTKIYISPLFIYLSVQFTDAETTDSEGFALEWMAMRLRTTLRYKSIRKTINDFMIDLFKNIEKKYEASDVKYTMKVDLEGRSANFFKEQFIKDLDPKEVDRFSVTLKRPRSIQTITDKNVSIITSRTEELVMAVQDLILRIN